MSAALFAIWKIKVVWAIMLSMGISLPCVRGAQGGAPPPSGNGNPIGFGLIFFYPS